MRLFRPSRLMLWSLLIFACVPANADYVAVITPTVKHGKWEGWGASACWWANQFGDRDDLADIAFTQKVVTWDGKMLPGLGLNIVRYNLGGCAPGMTVSPKIPPFKQIESFWLDWEKADPESKSFDWSRDAKQRAMLEKAKVRGADRFELFVNSPVWWMCINHNPSGADNGGDNLQNWNYQQFARSVAITVKQAKDDWGIPFQSVAPFNEPSANWWRADSTQEGCHFDVATQQKVIKLLRKELNTRGLSGTKISASDENSVDDALRTLKGFDASTKGIVGQINVHGYSGQEAYRGPNRGNLTRAASGKPLWVSEYGENDGSGMTMAQSLMLDFSELHPTAWVYWQPFDSGGWGLIQCNPSDNWIGPANPKYFVMAQFTRHIRPGMIILGTGDKNSVAAFDAMEKKLVIVTANVDSVEQRVTYDLSKFRSQRTKITRWITNSGGAESYSRYEDLSLDGRSFHARFPANSVQTFEIDGIAP